jgi:hypothetical protein
MGAEKFPFSPNPPATDESLSALVRATSAKPLPKEYIEFLRRVNGGEGFLGDNYARLWRAEELLEFNREYQAAELAPELFLIGSNGGGEAYAFDQSSATSVVFLVPFIGMEYQYIQKIADSFSSFVTYVHIDP